MENTAFIILNLLIVFSSYLIAYRHFRESRFSVQLVTAFLVYISQITFSILLLGVVVRNLDHAFILALNAAVSFFIIFIYRHFIKESLIESFKKAGNFFTFIFKTREFTLYALLFLFTVQVITVLVKMYYLPPHVWDVLVYHLHPVVEWVQQAQIPSIIPTPSSHVNFFPLGSKLIHFWFVKFSGETTWIELPQFIYGLALILTSYSIMRSIDIKKNTALKYALLIYFIPSILIETRTCQDHLVLTVIMLFTTLYFLAVFFPGPQKTGQKGQATPVVFLSMSLGLLLGSKISSPVIIFVFFTVLLFSKGLNPRKIYEFFIRHRTEIAAGLALIAVLGSYWHLKSGYALRLYSRRLIPALGSPYLWAGVFLLIILALVRRKYFKTFQVRDVLKKHRKLFIAGLFLALLIGGLGLFKNKDLLGPVLTGYTSPEPLLCDKSFNNRYPLFSGTFMKNILSFPFRIKDIGEHSAYSAGLLKMSGFGIQFITLGMIAYLVVAVRLVTRKIYRNDKVGFIFILSIALLASYYLYYYSRANYRLFMFFPVFGIILWAFVSGKLGLQPYYLKFINGLIVIMVLFNMATCFYEGNLDGQRWKTLFTLDDPLERTPVKYSQFLQQDEWQFLDRYVPPEEPVGFFGGKNLSAFAYFDNKMERKIYYLRPLGGYTLVSDGRRRFVLTPKLKERLKEKNIHYIHIHTRKVRHQGAKKEAVFIDDPSVVNVTGSLYYFKWKEFERKGRQS